jgi:O-antigen/teichoic acid export membrane protein
MSFKHQVIRGSAFMAFRLLAGAMIGVVGISLLTRFIGPANYGVFVAAHAILVYLITMTECGIGVYLIRLNRDEPEKFHQAFTLLLLFSVAGVGLGVVLAPLLARFYRLHEMQTAVLALTCGLPVVHAVKVPMARLERELDYKRVAVIELIGNVVYYVVALPLGYRGAGVIAPLAGWWAQQLAQLVQVYQTGYRPRLVWNPVLTRQMLSFGMPYSMSQLVLALEDLVNPMVVGRLLGAAAVGYVALGVRIVEQLGFVRTATTRISVAAFARVEGDPVRLARAISDGMYLQILALGPFLFGLSFIAPLVVPVIFGPKWTPVSQVYPWLGAAALVSAMFQLHLSGLTVLGLSTKQAIVQLVRLVLLSALTAVLVLRHGPVGYGMADLVSLPVFCLLLHIWISARTAPIQYAPAVVWLIAFSVSLFDETLGKGAWLALLIPLFWGRTRGQLIGLADLVRTSAPAAR